MNEANSVFGEVRAVVAKALGIEGRADSMTPATSLLGSIPEFDSMAVLKVLMALEEHFGVTIDDEEVTGDLFETLGTISAFVERKLE